MHCTSALHSAEVFNNAGASPGQGLFLLISCMGCSGGDAVGQACGVWALSPDSSPDRGHCVVFLGKVLHSQNALQW